MAEQLEDLNLPNMTVQKIIKNAIPDNVNIGKDARSALSKAATVFVLYVTSQATKEAQKVDRRALLGQDVISALEELEFDEFVDPLQKMLEELKETKKKRGSKPKKNAEEDVEIADDNEEQVDESIEEEESGD